LPVAPAQAVIKPTSSLKNYFLGSGCAAER
jgi:hypothetical protein